MLHAPAMVPRSASFASVASAHSARGFPLSPRSNSFAMLGPRSASFMAPSDGFALAQPPAGRLQSDMNYVGAGAGDWTEETTYRYVGMGAGEFRRAAVPQGGGSNVCCCILWLVPLVLCILALPLLYFLLRGTSTTSTTTTTTPPILTSMPPAPDLTTAPEYDCEKDDESDWSDAKQTWCCSHAEMGCPTPAPMPPPPPPPLPPPPPVLDQAPTETPPPETTTGADCLAGDPESWDTDKRVQCCLAAGKGCPTLPPEPSTDPPTTMAPTQAVPVAGVASPGVA